MRTVELVGDDALDRAVRAAWQRLDQAGLPSLARHQHPTNRPHLTLASADDFPLGAVAAVAEALQVLPISVRLDGLHFFGGRASVLAWAVDGGDALLDLQARIWSALDGADGNPQHKPGAWTPHISLARRLPPGQEAQAAEVIGSAAAEGALSAARSYDSSTRTVIALP
ncbi:MAG TPA: 2'-5' RNA ligase family protein [Streptosporangiaceae bacterium]